MRTLQKLTAVLLTIAIVCSAMTVSVFAAYGERYTVTSVSDHNASVRQLELELEEKYAITISYPTFGQDGGEAAGIYPATLETLDTALGYVSPYLVRSVSSYYQQTTGKRLRFSYRFSALNGESWSNEVTLAGFDPDEALIELYIPGPGEGAMMTGDTPMSIVHEFGHAVHMMLENEPGFSALESNWNAANGNYRYSAGNIVENPNDTVFVTGYGATSFAEDFAETFAHSFVCNRPGTGMSGKMGTTERPTPLGKKIAAIDSLLRTYYPKAETAYQNFRRLYTTPSSATYRGLQLSGYHLQFMGFPEPRYLPVGTLEQHSGISANQYRWISAIGGWFVDTGAENNIVVFPDGTWGFTIHNLT